MSLTPSTLRPGLLVALRTQITGNISYRRKDIEREHLTDEGQSQARWETERRVEDPTEHAQAVKMRSEARALVSRVCAASSFGLLCPETRTTTLEAAIAAAHEKIDAFNAESRRSKLALYVLIGRIVPDDVEALKAITGEIADLMATMEEGLATLDVCVVREAANKARGLETMLTENASARIKTAIATARKAARQIVKAGEQGAAAIDEAAIAKIAACRTAFLDFPDDEGNEPLAEPAVVMRMLDLEPATPAAGAITPGHIALDLEQETEDAYAV
jgi:hypothetical protein